MNSEENAMFGFFSHMKVSNIFMECFSTQRCMSFKFALNKIRNKVTFTKIPNKVSFKIIVFTSFYI